MDNKNQPAFPQPVAANEHGIWLARQGNIGEYEQVNGMSKREMFAMAAMQGLMAVENKGDHGNIENATAEAARISVMMADALLAELEKH